MSQSAVQGRLALQAEGEPSAVLAVARVLGITNVTLVERDGRSWWASTRGGKAGGSSGPCLDDYEAAVLIGAGAVSWSRWVSPSEFVLHARGRGGAA